MAAERSIGTHDAVQDCLFLGLVVLLSLLLYVQYLGFYSDDWAFLGSFSASPDRSFVGLFQSVYSDPLVRMRPVQILYLTALYWLFGPYPLGYHLVNAAVVLSTILLFYLALRELGEQRLLALAVPTVYALLPNYSTDRFWVAAFQANLSMALYFLSVYSDLRALQTRGPGFAGWKSVQVLSLLGSALAYEVALPLFLLNPLLVWYRGRQLYGPAWGRQLSRVRLALLLGSSLAALAVIVAVKLWTTTRLEDQSDFVRYVIWFFRGAIVLNYEKHTFGLPRTVWKILRDYPGWTVFAIGGLLGLIIFGYLHRVARHSTAGLPSQACMLRLVIGGVVVFGLGYAVFLVARQGQHTATGVSNRIAIAAAAGMALQLVGASGWLSGLLPAARLRRAVFCLLVAVLCTSGFLINNTLASFWTAAYRQAQEVLADIRQHMPELPPGSALILDGVCPYVGPAVVFESSWDLAGALAMLYGDATLKADVVTPNLTVEREGLRTLVYDSVESHYPYGAKLFVYHFDRKATYPLPDAMAARAYFERFNPDRSGGCPKGAEGYGVPVF